MQFTFEKLDVYQKAVQFASRVTNIGTTLKGKVSYPILNQFLRAALSISLNIAEGNGRWHINEKKQFFWIARGSCFEIVPILQILRDTGHLTNEQHSAYYQEVRAMAMMLTNLIKFVEKLNRSTNEARG